MIKKFNLILLLGFGSALQASGAIVPVIESTGLSTSSISSVSSVHATPTTPHERFADLMSLASANKYDELGEAFRSLNDEDRKAAAAFQSKKGGNSLLHFLVKGNTKKCVDVFELISTHVDDFEVKNAVGNTVKTLAQNNRDPRFLKIIHRREKVVLQEKDQFFSTRTATDTMPRKTAMSDSDDDGEDKDDDSTSFKEWSKFRNVFPNEADLMREWLSYVGGSIFPDELDRFKELLDVVDYNVIFEGSTLKDKILAPLIYPEDFSEGERKRGLELLRIAVPKIQSLSDDILDRVSVALQSAQALTSDHDIIAAAPAVTPGTLVPAEDHGEIAADDARAVTMGKALTHNNDDDSPASAKGPKKDPAFIEASEFFQQHPREAKFADDFYKFMNGEFPLRALNMDNVDFNVQFHNVRMIDSIIEPILDPSKHKLFANQRIRVLEFIQLVAPRVSLPIGLLEKVNAELKSNHESAALTQASGPAAIATTATIISSVVPAPAVIPGDITMPAAVFAAPILKSVGDPAITTAIAIPMVQASPEVQSAIASGAPIVTTGIPVSASVSVPAAIGAPLVAPSIPAAVTPPAPVSVATPVAAATVPAPVSAAIPAPIPVQAPAAIPPAIPAPVALVPVTIPARLVAPAPSAVVPSATPVAHPTAQASVALQAPVAVPAPFGGQLGAIPPVKSVKNWTMNKVIGGGLLVLAAGLIVGKIYLDSKKQPITAA